MNLKKAASFAVITAFSCSLLSCGPKDEDIRKAVEEKLRNTPGVTVTVKDGVATLSGEFADPGLKAATENDIKAIKGVKSVVDNTTVPPAPAPVVISEDDQLRSSAADALKAYSGLKAEVSQGVITLSGAVRKADLPKVMQALYALKPKKVENKAVIK